MMVSAIPEHSYHAAGERGPKESPDKDHMTEAQQHIIDIVRVADAMRPTDLMDLHNEAIGRLNARHEEEIRAWQADKDEIAARLQDAHVRNFDLTGKIERQRTLYFVILLAACCCVLWAVTK